MIKFKKTHPDAIIPTRATEGSAGFDIHSLDDFEISFGKTRSFDTGISVSIPAGWVGNVEPRSGLAFKHGIQTMAGTIDSDYTGELRILLTCLEYGNGVYIKKGDRIAQLVVTPYMGESMEVEELDETERASNGFGSTGR